MIEVKNMVSVTYEDNITVSVRCPNCERLTRPDGHVLADGGVLLSNPGGTCPKCGRVALKEVGK